MPWREAVVILVMLVVCINSAVYVRSILRREVRAHVLSWGVWFLTQAVGASAQFAKGGGVGTWPMFFGAATCLFIAILALFYHGERNITRGDWVAFVATLAAIPLWIATDNPLWAALIVSAIDGFGGIYPTFRKSWNKPHDESLFLFATATMNYALCVIALESYSLTTIVYPASMFVTHGALTAMLILRRGRVPKQN